MSVTQQYLLDTHRARQLGQPTPLAPGMGELRLLCALREYRRFRAVLAGRPALGRIRHTLARGADPRALWRLALMIRGRTRGPVFVTRRRPGAREGALAARSLPRHRPGPRL
ncbi:hypothetical protein GCM10010430_22090 [Kitasatospora cystarginea]|uniref:Uncharacterized protein n=1 Tax=Kitasatospora cystarginea TaxID=58350 RepID=A0ABP5QMC6_9ACTN